MTTYELLSKKQKKRNNFFKSEEYSYYSLNKAKLKSIPICPYLAKGKLDEFDIMRANILLQSLDNKENIEFEVENISKHFENGKKPTHEKYILALKERTIDFPYFNDGNIKIFIPFFSKALNTIYFREPEKLLKEPFVSLRTTVTGSLVDPFDTYGSELYNSSFTRLIKVSQRGIETAFFHYDTNCIYVINEQGRLDTKITLFDKYMKSFNYNKMLERISPCMEFYFDNNREGFIQSLFDNGFISKKMLSLINKNRRRR